MVITKLELQEFNKEKPNASLVEWVTDRRKGKTEKPKTERQLIIEKLTEAGVEFSKNSKTVDLKKLLEGGE